MLSRLFVWTGVLATVAVGQTLSAQESRPQTGAGAAATAPAQGRTGEFSEVNADSQERLSENHFKFIGGVELSLDRDARLSADQVEWFRDQDRAVATGNVVFVQGKNQIAADRADFNTRTRLGTFYNASGIGTVQPPRRSPMAGGIAPPPLSSQETEVYFFGDVVEKIGPKKYKITNGAFSTCVQPTPRWDFHADTVVLNIDHYTLLRNAVLNVKGVPLMYVPILYYPTKEEDRATGILIPTYGVSSLRGQAIHNAFFWAISRSQDATLMHDWYSKAGQGYGGEYRYNFGAGSEGTAAVHLLNQRQTTASTGSAALPATRAFELRGAANQTLPGRLQARGRMEYFSSVSVMQTYNTNVYDASRNQRSFGANVTGAWRTFSLNATVDRREYFASTTSSGLTGSTPRITLTRGERPLFRSSPVYFSASTEFAHLDWETRSDGRSTDNRSLSRFDVTPQVRYPFKKWQWFTVNSSFAWRDTYYTRSLALGETPAQSTITNDDTNRRFYTAQAQAVGPVLTRVWNTPDSGYAERFKHTIEPFMNVQRTSAIDNFARIVQVDGTDTIVGNTTNMTYGINNRLYAKRKSGQRASAAQEILSVEVQQTYYTSALAAQFDSRYNTSFSGAPPSNFSPISISVRALPSNVVNASMRAEIDSRHHELRTLTANGSITHSSFLQSNISWSKRFLVPELDGFNNPAFLDHSLNASTNVHTRDNRVGAIYSFNYDFRNRGFLQQRLSGFYSAQCCGIALEYQTYNFAGLGSILPPDRRFFLSFSLAGLGSFSPFNGAMGGMPR